MSWSFRLAGMRHVACLAFAMALCALSHAAQAETRVTGRLGHTINEPGISFEQTIDFTCTGAPECVGTYRYRLRLSICSNEFTVTDRFSMTGVQLAQAGNLTGVMTLFNFGIDFAFGQDGSCTIVAGPPEDNPAPYRGTWDGSNGTLTVGDPPDALLGTFTANLNAPPPVFPITVNARIDARTAHATATFTPRAQDAGRQANVYVFAFAPASIVRNPSAGTIAHDLIKAEGGPKDDPVPCVLAQMNAAGQLQGVSASSMQASLSGVLSAQGQSVTVLNNASTPNVAGATFFVGYGQSGTAMINGGVNRSAVTVPGSVVCAPQAPQTGWWWNPAEDGRGYSIEVQGNNIFFASFLYDVTGRSSWFVSTGPISLEGALYSGDLLAASGGQTLGGAYGGSPALRVEGPMTLAFNSASTGTIVWPGGTVPIQRFNIVPNGLTLAPAPNQPQSGWWWNEAESGRGFFMEWQGGTLDIAGYMYDAAGNPVWYLNVGTMTTPGGSTFAGNWWSYANGMTLAGPWRQHQRVNDNVAPVTITFSAPDTALMTLPNGRTTQLRRHRF